MSVTGDMEDELREWGWRQGIEASIRRLEGMQRKPKDLWHAAYFAALDEAIIHLKAMIERGSEHSTSELM